MPRLSKIGAAALAAFGWTGGATVSASYLVVAGGGGGGGASDTPAGGGGGAGGLLTGTASLNPTLSYTVTVGAAGAGGSSVTVGSNGSNSVFNAVTSVGGGGGGTYGYGSGVTGGSGGGAAWPTSYNAGSGTSGQGNAGGKNTTSGGSQGGGGGGGASAVGTTVTGNDGGAGGGGTASSISGSSVTYAGGGGGGAGAGNYPTYGTGGSATAGGGSGGNSSTVGANGTAGTANLGGGGGGAGASGPSPYTARSGGNGGSGVVIISYPAPQKFGGGVVTTSGSNVIHTFNTSGTLTPLSSLTASYLIVAGGGACVGWAGGGGGAGGLLSGSAILDSNSIYTVTVGAGGAGGSGASATSPSATQDGSVSSFSGVSVTATGGGSGGGYTGNARSGGSGGGGGNGSGTSNYLGASGTSGQGNAGGNALATYSVGGGGGGASAVGGNATSTTGGNGGAGTTVSSALGGGTYAGGGGGGANATSAGTGGAGGGGAGANGSPSTQVAGTSGTANTGGGGGGGSNWGTTSVTQASGGSGVVIISYAGSTQQMAGGTVTITGGNVIHTFTSSGYLTPIKYVNNSLRFRSSAYLNRTLGTATDSTKWTWSGWVKRGTLTSAQATLFAAYTNSSNFCFFMFNNTDDKIRLYVYSGGATVGDLTTNAVYRDPAAWYHVILSKTGTTFSLYVNGVSTSWSGTAPPSSVFINTATPHYIGQYGASGAYFDGYMTEINFIDGQALTPNSFGTFNSYGVWQPITYGGSYGTNGFYLPFTNKTSTTTLGYDFSPNGNNWTTNNISLTAGSTYDSMTDVPTLTSATAANYAVMNPLVTPTSGSLSSGNLNSSQTYQGFPSTIAMSSGQWYWEITGLTNTSSNNMRIGIAPLGYTVGTGTPGDLTGSYAYAANALKGSSGTYVSYGATYTDNDVIGVAFDATNGTLTFYKNGTSQGTAYTGISGTFFALTGSGSSATMTMCANFGQRGFAYTPPTGFVALNTYNL